VDFDVSTNFFEDFAAQCTLGISVAFLHAPAREDPILPSVVFYPFEEKQPAIRGDEDTTYTSAVFLPFVHIQSHLYSFSLFVRLSWEFWSFLRFAYLQTGGRRALSLWGVSVGDGQGKHRQLPAEMSDKSTNMLGRVCL